MRIADEVQKLKLKRADREVVGDLPVSRALLTI